jgi:hypothetical protein
MVISFQNPGASIPYQTYSTVMPFLAVSLNSINGNNFKHLYVCQILYPVLVILMVSLEKSKNEWKSANDLSLSQSIRFAPPQVLSQDRSKDLKPEMVESLADTAVSEAYNILTIGS